MVYQEALDALNPVKCIGNQIAEVLSLHQHVRGSALLNAGIKLLEEVGLDDPERAWNAYPHQLSGGMRQRAMIAMALAGDPDFLIADEPTTALDVTLQVQVMQLLTDLKKTRGMGILFITHNLPLVARHADRVALMRNGELLEAQEAKAFFRSPKTAYGQELLAAMLMNRAKQCKFLRKAKPKALLLKAQNLSVQYQTDTGLLHAVDDVSFSLTVGETLAVVGESGSGKSTLARAVMQLESLESGKVSYKGQCLQTALKHQLRNYRQQSQMVFQDPYQSLNPRHRVADIVLEGLDIHGQRLRGNKRNEAALALLEKVGLNEDYLHRYPHALSGGQRQRIAIARALALNPQLLICDEPTSALDISVSVQVLDLLLELQQSMGLGILLITHDFSVVRYMADRIMVMRKGRVLESGDAEQVLKTPSHEYTQSLLDSVPVL